MNHRIVLSTTGTVLYIEAAMMLIPLLIAMGFKEHKQALAFLAAILIATGVGFLLRRVAPPQRQDIFSKEGFVIVAMAGAFPGGGAAFYHQRRHSPLYRCAVRNGEWLYHHRRHPAAGCRGS